MSDVFEIFDRCAGIPLKLAEYGFVPGEDGTYSYAFELDRGAFTAAVLADADGRMHVSVTDSFTGEEYIALRTAGRKGAYAAKISKELNDVLSDIAARCCQACVLSSAQGMRLERKLIESGYALREGKQTSIYRGNRKIPGISFQRESDRDIVRIDGKKVILDDGVNDEEILDAVRKAGSAGRLPGERKEWLIPANPKYFDLDHGFAASAQLYWKQSFDAKPGDLVYIYYGMPYGEIRYLCAVTESDLPYKGAHDEPMKVDKLCRIRCLYRFEGGLLNREKLKELGIVNVRGARYMTQQLKDEIRRLYPEGGTIDE